MPINKGYNVVMHITYMFNNFYLISNFMSMIFIIIKFNLIMNFVKNNLN